MIDLSGKNFGRLIVLEQCGRNSDKRILWLCSCICGNSVVISGKLLSNGDTKSCGCLRKQLMTKHGHSRTRVYRTWQNMIQRCLNPLNKSYADYGGRGITICQRWLTFDNFLEDLGENPTNQTLDRIDNNKGYDKSNCKWSTPKQQSHNRRDNCLVTHNSRTQCLATWAEEVGISRAVIQYRLNRGWCIKRAIEQRPRKYKKKVI